MYLTFRNLNFTPIKKSIFKISKPTYIHQWSFHKNSLAPHVFVYIFRVRNFQKNTLNSELPMYTIFQKMLKISHIQGTLYLKDLHNFLSSNYAIL